MFAIIYLKLTQLYHTSTCACMSRCFALVENSGLEQVTAMDRVLSAISSENHESLVGSGITGTVHGVLSQCSPAIFKVNFNPPMKIHHAIIITTREHAIEDYRI